MFSFSRVSVLLLLASAVASISAAPTLIRPTHGTCSHTDLACNTTASGDTTQSACNGRDAQGRAYPINFYRISAQAGQRFSLTMRSSEIDSYLLLFDPSGAQVAEATSGAGGNDARLEYTPSVTGMYEVGATTYVPEARGAYTLEYTCPSTSCERPPEFIGWRLVADEVTLPVTFPCGDSAVFEPGNSLELSWTSAGESYSYEYELYEKSASGALSLLRRDTVSTNRVVLPGPWRSGGNYCVRVRAYRSNGIICVQAPCASWEYCDWTTYCCFRISGQSGCTLVTSPQSVSYDGGRAGCGTRAAVPPNRAVTFEWSAATGASQYEIELWSSDGSRAVQRLTATTTSQTSAGISAGLPAGQYAWRVRAYSGVDGGVTACAWSAYCFLSAEESGRVVVSSFTTGLAQPTDAGGAVDSFRIANFGGSSARVTLSRQGSFFQLADTIFTLSPGESREIVLTGLPQPQGYYEGAVVIAVEGMEGLISVPVRLISANRPSTPPAPRIDANRIDVPSNRGLVRGTFPLRNAGPGTVRGVVVSDAAWLIPDPGIVQLDAGESREVGFTIDVSKRPDAADPVGSITGTLTLRYLLSASGKSADSEYIGHDSPGTSTVSTTILSTVRPVVGSAAIPPIAPGEVALFVPGMGRITGSVGLFLSDLSLTNLLKAGTLSNIRMYYTPNGGGVSQVARLNGLTPSFNLNFGDLIRSVFNGDQQVGTIQIRANDPNNLGVNGTVFNSSNAKGTYGTAVPVFRSDRSSGVGQRLALTGLRRDATGHTNIYVQETSGQAASVSIEYYDAGGFALATQSVSVSPFGLVQLVNPLPEGARSAMVRPAGSGRIAAYATPVDRASGDTWTVADWASQYGYPPDAVTVIPVAGAVRGANDTYFRTDLAITNTSTAPASGVVGYYMREGGTRERTITLAPLATGTYDDVTTTLFSVNEANVGYLTFTPSNGTFAVTSRTYTTVLNDAATYGSSVPAIPLSRSLKRGEYRRIGGFDDASNASIASARPATFRTNFGLLETAGATATVRVTVRYVYPVGNVAQVGSASVDYTLNPRQFLLVNNISSAVLGSLRSAFGDLHNLQAEFEVISGDGAVTVFTSSVDNGSGDSIIRVD